MKNEMNIPEMSIGEVVSSLSEMYKNVINNNVDLNVLPSVMLWGPMGVGKSESIREIAQVLEKETNKKIKITDVRLLLFNPIDLRGIPTANNDKTKAVWLKPEIFALDSSSDVVNILFLDELSAAPQSVQAAAYQIALDKKVGEHELPKNTIVIAAGNRTSDKSVAVQMPKALANRLLHFNVYADFDSWNNWAISKGINSKVLGYLKARPNMLMNNNVSVSDLAFTTPRSWEKVSNILNYVNDDASKVKSLIAGLIGSGVAYEFVAWAKVYKKLPNIDDIFNGKCSEFPKDLDVLYALSSTIVHMAGIYKDNMSRVENAIEYAMNLPPDFSTIILKDMLEIDEDFKKELLSSSVFMKWMSKRGKLLDAAK